MSGTNKILVSLRAWFLLPRITIPFPVAIAVVLLPMRIGTGAGRPLSVEKVVLDEQR